MEKLLEKLAKHLAALDEASLMSLWDKYQEKVKNFEPTKQWEEAVLVFGMIQAVRWKNQLFNAKWEGSQKNQASGSKVEGPREQARPEGIKEKEEDLKDRGRIIPFNFKQEDDSE